jgi:tetratricopeptide (TPR) repeat protein
LGDTSGAIADYSQLIKLDPNKAKPYYDRANAYKISGDYENAIKDASKACELGDCVLLKLLDKEKPILD